MSRNPGKDWEADFYNSFEGDERYRLLRLYDTTNGFKGVANPCDFVYYRYPHIVYLELKSVKGTRLPFSSITDNQWEQLSAYNKQNGALGAIFVQFREVDRAYLIPIHVLNRFREEGRKSVSQLEIEVWTKDGFSSDFRACEVVLNYRISRCSVDVGSFSRAISLLGFIDGGMGE